MLLTAPEQYGLEDLLGLGLRLWPEQVAMAGGDLPEYVMVVAQLEDPYHAYGCGGYGCHAGIYCGDSALVVPRLIMVGAASNFGYSLQGDDEGDALFPHLDGAWMHPIYGETFDQRTRLWDCLPLDADSVPYVEMAEEYAMETELLSRRREYAELTAGECDIEPEQVFTPDELLEWSDRDEDDFYEEMAERRDQYVDKLDVRVTELHERMTQADLDAEMGLTPALRYRWLQLQRSSRKNWLHLNAAMANRPWLNQENWTFNPWY